MMETKDYLSYFYMDLIENENAVLELTDKIKTLLFSFLDEWFRRYGHEFIPHYPSYYMCSGITLSEDEVGAISPALFRRLFLPELTELSQRYGGIGIHCCANSRHQWENFLDIPNMKMLNLGQPVPVTRESMEFFAAAVPQFPGNPGEGHLENWIDALPKNAHICINTSAKDLDDAKRICGLFAEHNAKL